MLEFVCLLSLSGAQTRRWWHLCSVGETAAGEGAFGCLKSIRHVEEGTNEDAGLYLNRHEQNLFIIDLRIGRGVLYSCQADENSDCCDGKLIVSISLVTERLIYTCGDIHFIFITHRIQFPSVKPIWILPWLDCLILFHFSTPETSVKNYRLWNMQPK